MTKYWINYSHGMELSPISTEYQERSGNENGILFYLVYLAVLDTHDILMPEDIEVFKKICIELQTHNDNTQIKGLYDRGAHESHNDHPYYKLPEKRRKISHDNITAISIGSRYFNLPFAKHIAQYAINNQFKFDNRYPNNQRFIFKNSQDKLDTSLQPHPRDWFLWLFNGGGFYRVLSYIFFPVFLIANIMTCYTPKEETSGKQLMFARLAFGSKISWLMRFNYWICKKILRKAYGKYFMYEIFKIYYKNENHPIRTLSKGLLIK